MHEAAIAREISAIILEEIKKAGAKRALKIHLVFGELTSVVPEALDFAFRCGAEGTALEGAKLKIEIQKMRAKCRVCGKSYRASDFIHICPECGSAETELISGKEMLVKSIKME